MHYVRIAIAIAIGVGLGLSLDKKGDSIFAEIKKLFKFIGGAIKIYGLAILKILGIICAVGLGGYLVYRFCKWVDWDIVLVIILWIGCIALLLFIFSWLFKITHKKKK